MHNTHEIRGLDHQNPLTEAAIMRLLLAFVHRIINGPRNLKEWTELYRSDQLPLQLVNDYLGKWEHRFDLFSEEDPFYQTAGLAVLNNASNPAPAPISYLMLERASGHNKTIFDHSTDEVPFFLPPAESALALVTAQMYGLEGLNKKTTNLFGFQQSFYRGVMANGIFVAMQGANLFETLMLNLLIYKENEPIPSKESDCPVWERDDRGGVGPSVPRGYLDYLTCKCRHIRLIPERNGGAIGVRFAHIAQGEVFHDVDNPATIKRRKRDGSWFPLQLNPDRLVWRDSSSLFSFDDQVDRRPKVFRLLGDIALKKVVPLPSKYRCVAYGIANDQANPLAWRKESLTVPLNLLSDQALVAYLQKALDFSEKAGAILGDCVREYIAECLPKRCKKEVIIAKINTTGVLRRYWDRLERHFHLFLEGIEETDKALETWLKSVKGTARESFELCLKHHYADSAIRYRAWTLANGLLNARLSSLERKEGRE